MKAARVLLGRLPKNAGWMALGIALYFAVSIPIARNNAFFIHHLLVWNVFLALVALLFALGMHLCERGVLAALFGVCWFFFFPNAPYLVTDLMHITYLRFYSSTPGGILSDWRPWFVLMHLALGVFFGTVMGLYSLQLVHLRMRRRLGAVASWIVIGWISLCSGYAMYLGRYLRLNSWDMLKPELLLRGIARNTHWFSLQVSLIFAAYVFFSYAVYCAFHRVEPNALQEKTEPERSAAPHAGRNDDAYSGDSWPAARS